MTLQTWHPICIELMDKTDPAWKNYAQELGINIARVRTAKGYFENRVVADVGLSRFTYWKLECRESNPDTPANPRLRSILAVTQVLDVELADLLPKHIPDLRYR